MGTALTRKARGVLNNRRSFMVEEMKKQASKGRAEARFYLPALGLKDDGHVTAILYELSKLISREDGLQCAVDNDGGQLSLLVTWATAPKAPTIAQEILSFLQYWETNKKTAE